jgi:hypothetical protein
MASNDPAFEQKATDIIGLYMDPPQHAAVFCVDEKTAIQALDRFDPALPLSPGRAERHGFEYYRHGTLSLLYGAGGADGKSAGQNCATSYHCGVRRFSRKGGRQCAASQNSGNGKPRTSSKRSSSVTHVQRSRNLILSYSALVLGKPIPSPAGALAGFDSRRRGVHDGIGTCSRSSAMCLWQICDASNYKHT